MSKPTISAIVITYNEAHNIQRCLDSLKFCNEIIVFDSGSKDDTVAICRRYTDKIWEADWPGDGPQKNRAFEKATSDWLLCVDADEVVTSKLADEIQQAISNTSHVAFDIPFLSHYLGKAIHWGDWRKESHIRLLQRGAGHFTPAYVYGADGAHCRLELSGTVGCLKGKMFHYPFPTVERLLEKVNAYSSGSAAIKHYQGKTGGVLTAMAHGLWAFFRGYVFRLGFLDGGAGFMLAVSNAEGTYYRYIKLGLMNKSSPRSKEASRVS
tara:strand:+ start:115 stop:915 length:801 start_codon:yes stop_codon:yes gene_type:complete